MGRFDGGAEPFIGGEGGIEFFRGAHGQVIDANVCAIKSRGQRHQGFIAFVAHQVDNLPGAFFDGWIEEAGGAGEGLKAGGKVLIRVPDDVHWA